METRRLCQISLKVSLAFATLCILSLGIRRDWSPTLGARFGAGSSNPVGTTTGPRPESKTEVTSLNVAGENKAFLGTRLDPNTIVNASRIVEACNGSGVEGWRDTSGCIDYLRYREDDYLSVDPAAGPSCDAEHAIKYHTYWRGPLSWRVSFMLKSFLFTQNLECSRMHIWLDADYDPQTVEHVLESPILKPYLHLVESGLINLRTWRYPSQVYVPPEHQEDDFPANNMLSFRQYHIPRGAVAVSDSVRFIILHQEGGLYIDMDTMFLRDFRPLMITPGLAFAERWGAHPGLGEYNTAYLRLQPNSTLSSRILQGAARMGCNFHPRVVGRMLAKTGHQNDLTMFETGVFDPLWSFFDRDNIGNCSVPCLTSFAQFYDKYAITNEWSMLQDGDTLAQVRSQGNVNHLIQNRTLQNFFRGSYVHHIHNQWHKQVVPGSWVWVADQTYNQFLSGARPNPYGEYWPVAMDLSAEEKGYRP